MIRSEGISFTAGDKVILDDVSVEIVPGEVTAILGPNGAGKSTLLKCLSGSRRPAAGRVTMKGTPLEQYPPEDLARERAALSQSVYISFPFSVFEVCHMGRNPHRANGNTAEDFEVVKAALEQLDVWHLKDRVFPTLSGGEQQRVHLARVLAQVWERKDACLLLDEPTAALDLKHRHATFALLEKIAQRGAAVCVILHDLVLAMRYASRAILMKNGKIFSSGETRNVLNPENISAVFEVDYDLVFGKKQRD